MFRSLSVCQAVSPSFTFYWESLHPANKINEPGSQRCSFFLKQHSTISLHRDNKKDQQPIHPPNKPFSFHPNHSTMPRSMAIVLTTALIAVTALALPDAAPPTAPPGLSPGGKFDDRLEFRPYKGVDCHGTAAAVFEGQYGYWEAFQMQSYSLSRSLKHYETLDFYSGIGTDGKINHTVDNSKSGHFSVSCLKFDLRAGVNATTSDTGDSPHGRDKGCHTLVHNEWCANIWIEFNP